MTHIAVERNAVKMLAKTRIQTTSRRFLSECPGREGAGREEAGKRGREGEEARESTTPSACLPPNCMFCTQLIPQVSLRWPVPSSTPPDTLASVCDHQEGKSRTHKHKSSKSRPCWGYIDAGDVMRAGDRRREEERSGRREDAASFQINMMQHQWASPNDGGP